MTIPIRQNTNQIITVGPFLDKTDGVNPEISLTVTGCHITLIADTADGNVPTLVIDADATASGGDNNLVHITNDNAGYYSLELTTTQTNRVGGGRLCINDDDVHAPVFHDVEFLPANVFDARFGTDKLFVDVVEISGDSTAADNEESFFDGEGYAGTNNIIPTVTNVTNLHASAATADELAKVPKSDSNVSWNATALAAINAEVDTALNTAIPGSPTSDSINERIKALDDHVTADYGSTEKAAVDLLDDTDGGIGDIHTVVNAITAKTTNLPASPAAVGSAMTLADDAITSAKFDESTAFPLKSADASTTILARAGDKMDIIDAPNSTGILAFVDAFLTRDWSSVSYTGTVRCVLTALQKLRNKVANSGGTQTVYKENDSTSSYTSTIVTDAGADPVISIDPDA